jgi:hypothetical protein
MTKDPNTLSKWLLLDANDNVLAVDQLGRFAGMAAWKRMLDRMAETAGVTLRSNGDGTFDNGLTLDGPFHA